MTGEQAAPDANTISGGIVFGPVLQGANLQADFHLPAPAPVAMSQIPAQVAGFTGRDDDLAVLINLLDPAGHLGAVVVSAVAGLAGVGKTGLAIQAGHAVLGNGWYPAASCSSTCTGTTTGLSNPPRPLTPFCAL